MAFRFGAPALAGDEAPAGGASAAFARLKALEGEWTGTGGPYQVQRRGSLTSGDWANVGEPTTATTATIPVADGSGYFRVVN